MVTDKVHCPFKGRDECTGGSKGGRGFAPQYLLQHIRRQHLPSEELVACYKKLLSHDVSVFDAVNSTLRTIGQWMCGDCLGIQALKKQCKHDPAVPIFPPALDSKGECSCCIIGIPRPPSCQPSVAPFSDVVLSPSTLGVHSLDKLFSCSSRTVKSIPPACRLAFSDTLKAVLWDVVGNPSSIEAWVRLLALPACTLSIFIPKDRNDKRSGNRKALQQRHILQSLAVWNEVEGSIKLVERVSVGCCSHTSLLKKMKMVCEKSSCY